MTALLKSESITSVFNEVLNHPAWMGDIAGLPAEKMLRGKKTPFLFILRKGETSVVDHEENYYVTYLDAELIVRHQPLILTETLEGYYFENGGSGGPFVDVTIDQIIPLVIHCEQGESIPFVRSE